MMRPRLRRPEMRRAIVLSPNGLTLANLFFGIFAIVSASRGDYSKAGLWVVCGGIADAFDGRVARTVGATGRFGEELDSLVDVVTFGLAPALIMYFAVLERDGSDWIWSFVFTACAVWRLARFTAAEPSQPQRVMLACESEFDACVPDVVSLARQLAAEIRGREPAGLAETYYAERAAGAA